MPHVVTGSCKGCKYTDCVSVCPVDCFYEGEDMLYIHPDDCIDCMACIAECPVQAIYPDVDLPDSLQHFIQMNAEQSLQCPNITEKKKPMCE